LEKSFGSGETESLLIYDGNFGYVAIGIHYDRFDKDESVRQPGDLIPIKRLPRALWPDIWLNNCCPSAAICDMASSDGKVWILAAGAIIPCFHGRLISV